ncbi:hypothetical protein ACFLZA_00805 [Candidatus Neomarinimicrobiota bacterium]
MADVFNIIQQIDKLKSESKYSQKKAVIGSLIAIFTHARAKYNTVDYTLIEISIYTNDSVSRRFRGENIMVRDDEILIYMKDKFEHLYNISDITKILVNNKIAGIPEPFVYKFDN